MTNKKYSSNITYKICDYPPYKRFGEDNPNRNEFTYRIMDLKNPSARKHEEAVAYFGEGFRNGVKRLANSINVTVLQIAIVPSSSANKRSQGLEAIVDSVKEVEIIYEPDFLVRIESIPSAHSGGVRDKAKHIQTITVNKKPDPNIPTIILDDVTTTGSTMDACYEILSNAGVKTLYKIAIGKTV